MPGALTVKSEAVEPSLQAYVPPPVAVNVPEVVVQDKVREAGEIAAVGGVVFTFTTREAVAVQPFVGFVTVTE